MRSFRYALHFEKLKALVHLRVVDEEGHLVLPDEDGDGIAPARHADDTTVADADRHVASGAHHRPYGPCAIDIGPHACVSDRAWWRRKSGSGDGSADGAAAESDVAPLRLGIKGKREVSAEWAVRVTPRGDWSVLSAPKSVFVHAGEPAHVTVVMRRWARLEFTLVAEADEALAEVSNDVSHKDPVS